MKFPLPDQRDPFSLKPGCISVVSPNSKSSEVDASSGLSLAIAGARAAASQFSKKDQNSQSRIQENAPDNMNTGREEAEAVKSYSLRSRSRSSEKDKASSNSLDEKYDDRALPSRNEEKRSRNKYEGSNRQNQAHDADLTQYPQPPSKVCSLSSFLDWLLF